MQLTRLLTRCCSQPTHQPPTGYLPQFVDVVTKAKIPNFLVVALDERTVTFLKTRKTPHYLRKLRSASGSTDNHATSGLKFQILHELLSVSGEWRVASGE